MKFLWILLIIDLWLCDVVEAQMFILNIILFPIILPMCKTVDRQNDLLKICVIMMFYL